MNPARLEALFAAHKTAILGTAAAGVAGLALYRKKKGTGASAQPAGTIPAAAVVSAGGSIGGGGYDSSAYDVYAALQSELEPILQQYQQRQQTGGPGTGVTTAPKPVKSPLLDPAPKKVATPPKKPAPKVTAKKPAPKKPATGHIDTWVTVRPGDSLSEIASHYKPADITWQSLAKLNAIQNPNLIHPGQKIHVVG